MRPGAPWRVPPRGRARPRARRRNAGRCGCVARARRSGCGAMRDRTSMAPCGHLPSRTELHCDSDGRAPEAAPVEVEEPREQGLDVEGADVLAARAGERLADLRVIEEV